MRYPAFAAVTALLGSLALVAGATRDEPPARLRREPECALPVAVATEALVESGRYWHALRSLPGQRATGVLAME